MQLEREGGRPGVVDLGVGGCDLGPVWRTGSGVEVFWSMIRLVFVAESLYPPL